ncbi:MAG: peptidase [Epsilonproteobacteria bacterium]|nr:peptidase [Campylobacterota bacterium]
MEKKLREKIVGRVFYRNATICQGKTYTEERANPSSDTKASTFILISTDNAVERYDFWEDKTYIEELDIKGADYSQLKTFFKDHNPRVDTAIGRIENKRVKKSELLADVIFASDLDSQVVKQKYQEGILTDVSIGYMINYFVETSKKDEPNHVLVTDYTIVELSAVWKGADIGAVKLKQNEGEQADEREKVEEVYEVVPRSVLERKLKLKIKEI